MRLDARIPVRFGILADAGDKDALLLSPGMAPVPGWPTAALDATAYHHGNCACCVARNGAAQALGGLFLRRARGQVGFFSAVLAIVGPDDAVQVRAALVADPLVSGRYRAA